MVWAVAAVDDDATWVPAFLEVVADEFHKMYHLLLRYWETAKALGPPAPAATVEILESIRSRTTVARAKRGRVAATRTGRYKNNYCDINSFFLIKKQL